MERLKRLLIRLRQPVITIRLFGVLAIIVAGVITFLGYLNQHSGIYVPSFFVQDFYANASAELASIAITVLVIDYLNDWRQKRQLKEQLTRDLLSNVTDYAVRAIDELREHDWWDEVLQEQRRKLSNVKWQGAKLQGANLENADLVLANLENADLVLANLEDANLTGAYLENAHLMETHLENASLMGAKLENAHLIRANLRNANLTGAYLENAWLIETNLENAILHSANLENAILHSTNLENADLKKAKLTGARSTTPTQLLQAASLEGATMPDGTLFEEWIQHHQPEANSQPPKTIKQHVQEVAEATDQHPNKIYRQLREAFNISSYKDITGEQLEKAHEFLDSYEKP